MTLIDFQKSSFLGAVILQYIQQDSVFKDLLKQNNPSFAADIESASTNPNCSCRTRVAGNVVSNADAVGSLLFTYANTYNKLDIITQLFTNAQNTPQNAAGRVAKTSIADWPDFAKTVAQSGLVFKHMSTSVIGDDVYVFFL
jgi:hypothetical protein